MERTELKKLKTKLDSSPIITQTRGPGGNDPVDTSPDVEPVPWWSVDTSNLKSVKEFLDKHKDIDILVFIQITNPFINHIYIDKAIKKYL